MPEGVVVDGAGTPATAPPTAEAAPVVEGKSKGEEESQRDQKRTEEDGESKTIEPGPGSVVDAGSSVQAGVPNGVVKVEEPTAVIADGEGKDKGTETYVGEATWEERTWKELVRLKEDMFLARIGALR